MTLRRKRRPQAEEKMTVSDLEGIITKNHGNVLTRLKSGATLTEAELKLYRRILKERDRDEKLKQIKTGDVMGPEEARWSTKVRRRRVFEATLKNMSVRDMVEAGIGSSATIVEDLKAIRGELNAAIDMTQANRIFNEKLAEFQALKMIALDGLEDAEGTERVGYLRVATAIVQAEIALFQDAAVLSKAALKTEITGKDGGPIQTAPLIQVSMNAPGEDDEFPEEKIVYLEEGSGGKRR